MRDKIDTRQPTGLVRALGPIDATMIVMGSMIGSGIFITSAESARLIGAPGWLLLAWGVAVALGLPVVAGLGELFRWVSDGDRVLVDGDLGIATVNPSRVDVAAHRRR